MSCSPAKGVACIVSQGVFALCNTESALCNPLVLTITEHDRRQADKDVFIRGGGGRMVESILRFWSSQVCCAMWHT